MIPPSSGDWGPTLRSALASDGDVNLDPGMHTISSADDLNHALTLPILGNRLRGAGRTRTIIDIAVDNLAWGVALTAAQQELAELTVQFSGATAPPWLVGMPGMPGRSAESCSFTRVNATFGVGAIIPIPASAVGAALFAIGPDYPGTSTFDPANARFTQCAATSRTEKTQRVSGYLLGNGTSGNVLEITADDCLATFCTYGVQLAGCGIRWWAGGMSQNTDTDIVMQHGATDPAVFVGLRGEAGNRMVWGGNIGATSGLALEHCVFDSYAPSEVPGQVVKWNAQGALTISGGRMNTKAANTNFGLCTDGGRPVGLITNGLWTDVNPYPAANTARYRRFVTNAMVGVNVPLPLSGFQQLADAA